MVVTLELATNQHCRTVLSGHGLQTLFCGEIVQPGRSYCPACCAVYFVKPPKPKRKRRAPGVVDFVHWKAAG